MMRGQDNSNAKADRHNEQGRVKGVLFKHGPQHDLDLAGYDLVDVVNFTRHKRKWDDDQDDGSEGDDWDVLFDDRDLRW